MTDLKTLVDTKNAILFDMDGTIVNTEGLHAKAATLVLKEMGIKIDIESMLTQFYGMTDTLVLKTTCPQLTDQEIQSAIGNKNKYLISIFKAMKQSEKNHFITPGLFDFLNYLKKQNKKMGVVSASEDIIVTETLKTFGLSSFMEIQMGRNQTKLTKPNPDPYLEGMRRLNSTANDTLIFEDSPTGLTSANASGAFTVRITEFSHTKEISVYTEINNFLNLSIV